MLVACRRQPAPDAEAGAALCLIISQPQRSKQRRLVVLASQIAGIHEVDDSFFKAAGHELTILPAEPDRAGRAEVEILPSKIIPVRRQEIILERQVLQRHGDDRVGIIAGDRIKSPVGGAAIDFSIVPDDWASAAPDARGVRIREQHLADHRMMRIANIHRIHAGEARATTLRKRGVYRAVDQIQTPALGKWSHKLDRTEANSATAEVQAVEGAVRRNHVQDAGALIDDWCCGDAIRAEKGALEGPLSRQRDDLEEVAPKLLARLSVQRENRAADAGDVHHSASTLSGRDVGGHHRRG